MLYQSMKLLPAEKYIFYADTDNVPYGIKPSTEIEKLVLEAAIFLDAFNPKALVVACNTATSVVIEKLRNIYSYPVIGMEPAVKPASEIADSRKILVCATIRTLQEEKLDRLISGLNVKDRVKKLSLQELVRFAENKEFHSPAVEGYLKKCFKDIEWDSYSSVVLGCTHFLYFTKLIHTIIPEGISILDGNLGTVNRLSTLIQRNSLTRNIKNELYLSGRSVNWNYLDDFIVQLESELISQAKSKP